MSQSCWHRGSAQETVICWDGSHENSGSYLYNGFEYKLIKHEAAGLSLLLGFASKNKIGCPGPGINCTSFLSIIENDGSVAFDLCPESFECLCEGKKAKRLDHFDLRDSEACTQ